MKRNHAKYTRLRNLFYGFAIAGFIGSGIFYCNNFVDKNNRIEKNNLKGTISYVFGIGSFVLAARQNSKKKELEFLVKGA